MELQEDEPYLVARLILWLYTSSYPRDDVNSSKIAQRHPKHIVDPHCVPQDQSKPPTLDWANTCRLHLQMATLADKYGMRDLVREGFRRFVKTLVTEDKIDFPLMQSSAPMPLQMVTTERLNLLRECCETPGSCATFFRTYALSMLHQWIHRDGPASARVETLVRDCPDIAVSLATSHLLSTQWHCSSCDVWLNVLVRRCACLNHGGCKRKECIDAIKRENICWRCFDFDTLSPLSNYP